MKRICAWVFAVAFALAPLIAEAGTIVYYHNDLLGSPAVATDAAGNVIWRESYRPYGERLINDPASSANDVWFTGRRQDAASGLVYMGARYYDPVVGRFISVDPKGFSEGNIHSFNRYAYANNNSYRYIDPDGKEPGNLYQRGYALPIPNFSAERGLGRSIPEASALPLLVPGIGATISATILRGAAEAPMPGGGLDASSAVSAVRLKNQLSAEEIAAGHAFDKHVVDMGEFGELGITTRGQFASHIESVLNNPSAMKDLSGGRTAFWSEQSNTVVIRNPSAADGGTPFQPFNGKAYFDGLR